MPTTYLNTCLTDGTSETSIKAASTAAIATDRALVVAVSPNNTPVLPAGAALDATLTSRSQKSQVTNGTRDGTIKAASTPATNADTALVVAPLRQIKATYRAATTANVVAAAGSAMFFVITGSATKTLRIKRISFSGESLTAVAYNSVVVEKWSTAPTSGTATTLTQVPLDSNFAAATANLCQVYTAAPTEGSLVGTIACVRDLYEATTAAAAGIPRFREFIFGSEESECPVLRGTAQALSLAFGANPASAVTLGVFIEWTEE